MTADLQTGCDLLRSLHRPGAPPVLPNAWAAATARAVVAAGFPVVATTSDGVAGTLGYEDHEGAPGEEMLAADARIAFSERYERWHDYRVDPRGFGLHGLDLAPGEVVRLTPAEVEAHPAWHAFGS